MQDNLIAQIVAAQRLRNITILILALVALPVGSAIAIMAMTESHRVRVYAELTPIVEPALRTTEGVGFQIGRRYFLLSSSATLVFSSPSHSPLSLQVVKGDGDDLIDGVLAPMPISVEVSTSVPVDGTWLLNNDYVGKGTSTILSLSPGSIYSVEFVDPYGRSKVVEFKIDLNGVQENRFEIDLSDWS